MSIGTGIQCQKHGLIYVEECYECLKEERAHTQTIDERGRYHDWADKLAGAIAAHMREDIGEHSNLNNPWANALELIDSTFCRWSRKGTQWKP